MAQATSAPEAQPASDEEDTEQRRPACVQNEHSEIVDQIIFQEKEEFEALISLMDDQSPKIDEYGNDDEEYDSLFMEVFGKIHSSANSVSRAEVFEQKDNQEMDVSSG
ncbi:MAG: hypothetical protein Q9164_000120 [Protoblastenia rupestris]